MAILTPPVEPTAKPGNPIRPRPLTRPRRWYRGLLGVVLSAWVLSGAIGAPAAPPTSAVNEYQVKAAFLYNFAKFVEWPAEAFTDSHAPIILGILGEDPFGPALDETVKGKTVQGRALAVNRLKRTQNLKACHILFIGRSEKKHWPQILADLKGSSVLTVSEMDRFAQQGGIVNFFKEGNKVRFEINVDMAARVRLKVSAKLLTLANIVRDEPPTGKS